MVTSNDLINSIQTGKLTTFKEQFRELFLNKLNMHPSITQFKQSYSELERFVSDLKSINKIYGNSEKK